MASGTTRTLMALLVGATVGAGIGILFAPDEGRRTRRKLRDSFDDATESLRHRLHDLTEDFKHKKERFKGTLEESVEALLSKSNHKAEEVIDILEKKLEELKKAKAKLEK